MSELEIRVTGERVQVLQGRRKLAESRVDQMAEKLAARRAARPLCGFYPEGVKLWIERRDAVGLVLETPPDARSVRWLSDDSKAPYGPRAKYEDAYLSFPFGVVILVLRRGSLTGYQQMYYRTAPLAQDDEDLLMTNLYNVAQGYRQRSWVCLANMADVGHLSWAQKIEQVRYHIFSASFNQSSERHEGNSYWSTPTSVDPRVASLEAWKAATLEDPLFALKVPWTPAGRTATAELLSMLDQVVVEQPLRTATDVAGLLAARGRRGKAR